MSNIKSFLFDYRQQVDQKIALIQSTYQNTQNSLLAIDRLFERIRDRFEWDKTSEPEVNTIAKTVDMVCWVSKKEISNVMKKLCDGYFFENADYEGIPTVFRCGAYTIVIKEYYNDGYILSCRY